MTDIQSLIFYIVMFSISITLYYFAEKTNLSKALNIVLIISSFTVLSLVAALRYNVGTDYENYVRLIYSLNDMSFKEYIMDGNIEIGFYILRFIGFSFQSHQLTFFLSSFLSLLFIHVGLKNFSINSILPFAFYVFTIFPISFNLVRQGISICIIFAAFGFLSKRDYKKYILLTILSSLFHLTSIFTFIILLFDFRFLNGSKHQKIVIYGIIFAFISVVPMIVMNYQSIVSFLSQFAIFSDLERYTNTLSIGKNRDIVLNAIILLFILLFSYRQYRSDKNITYLLFLLLFGFILSFTGIFNPYVKRISYYFEIIYVLFFLIIIKSFKDPINRFIGKLVVLSFSVLKFVVVFYIIGNNEIFPYSFLGVYL